jgi:acylphosphatase
MRTVALTVFGRVQGVGFRYATKLAADRCGVNGIVRNLLNGAVYIEASGTSAKIAKFIGKIKNSPTPYGKVNRVDLVDLQPKAYTDFRITN